ncbi:hypothetical protein B0H66DRAFT_571801 [Apodospora peruviana]|uniref:MARVEL domain-containing protein n=1 Tax=Apodospora peruviana TaxID=516989 RepID=A0AAE0IQ33_9PEZI|nr:hypothetical protein B0H66DRAFT_571801 [Apodospora peruviana]
MADGPAPHTTTNKSDQTGLLTRWVPERLKHSALYRWVLRLTRVLQFLSAVISLGLFSSRLYKVYRLVNSIKTAVGVNRAFGAVEGILAAAVLYTLLAMLTSLILKNGGPRWLRWGGVLLDLAFVGAFIAVAVLTSPKGGQAGPKHCYDNRDATDNNNLTGETANTRDHSCNLPWGTFILAIVSTILHAITAAFHEVRDRIKDHRYSKEAEAQMIADQHRVQGTGNGYHAGNGVNAGTARAI